MVYAVIQLKVVNDQTASKHSVFKGPWPGNCIQLNLNRWLLQRLPVVIQLKKT